MCNHNNNSGMNEFTVINVSKVGCPADLIDLTAHLIETEILIKYKTIVL